ncbi:MAG: F0F1 ATP synthase subunit delta, partial [Anaerolineaceae bacterium]|nr:F0F1 ATP synthase subunit delta [Anaerolineaceae bacterium]
ELLAATHEEANQILKNAMLEVRKEQLFDMKTHQAKIVDVIIKITSKTLKEVTPKAVHDSLIEELLQNIWDLGKTDIRQVQTIRDSLSERIPTAKVSVAVPMTIEQERNLVQTFNALADRDVNVEIEEDPELISGLKVRMGDLIIENSLASQLEDYVDEIKGSLYQLNETHD